MAEPKRKGKAAGAEEITPPASPQADSGLKPGEFLTVRLSRLGRILSRQSNQNLNSLFGLTLSEWRCVATLATSGPVSAADLVRTTGCDRAQISRTISSLVKRGLIMRLEDSRKKPLPLVLTEKGWDLYKQILPWGRERQRRLLSLLDQSQLGALNHAIEILTAQLQAEIDITH